MAYPIPVFQFRVNVAGLTAEFSEVSGISEEIQPIEYRHGLSKNYSATKMPGLVKLGNVTLKRGIFKNNNEFFEWVKKIKMNTVERADVLISLLDEEGNPTMEWQLQKAWPCKITGADLKAMGNEVSVEALELAYEALTINNG